MKQLAQKLPLPLMQTQWASAINPVLSNVLIDGVLNQNVVLASGSNTVNHRLGKALTGWFITRMRGSFVQIYDTQDSNPNPTLTLTLNSSGSCTVDIYCF